MKEFFKQLTTIWTEMQRLHRGCCLGILMALLVALSFVLWNTSRTHWIPLLPNKHYSVSEKGALEAYLKEEGVPYHIDVDNGVRVAADKASQVLSYLSRMNKGEEAKGYELFDTNTWIKGEKELQVLEMRALKGQLERDLSAFENIKCANVILDIPPQKTFNSQKLQTKASVILTLMPGESLSISHLRAITNHLTGAVRGLESHMIAISDTSGKLYKSIDPKGEEENVLKESFLLEELIEKKISSLLTKLVGIENQLISITKGSGMGERPYADTSDQKGPHFKLGIGWIFSLLFMVSALGTLFLFVRKLKKNQSPKDKSLFKLMTRVDMKKLAESVDNEDPEMIALMISYLEPKKAGEMLTSLKSEIQEEVLFYLTEMEKREAK